MINILWSCYLVGELSVGKSVLFILMLGKDSIHEHISYDY